MYVGDVRARNVRVEVDDARGAVGVMNFAVWVHCTVLQTVVFFAPPGVGPVSHGCVTPPRAWRIHCQQVNDVREMTVNVVVAMFRRLGDDTRFPSNRL